MLSQNLLTINLYFKSNTRWRKLKLFLYLRHNCYVLNSFYLFDSFELHQVIPLIFDFSKKTHFDFSERWWEKKLPRCKYQLINYWGVLVHLHKVHKYEFLAGAPKIQNGILDQKFWWWILADPETGLLWK